MNKGEYEKINLYMQKKMDSFDVVHGTGHIYRVLKNAMDIVEHCEGEVDREILIVSCLLHDIGRNEKGKNVSHADSGSEMAYNYLKSIGWSAERAKQVFDAIKNHTQRIEKEDLSMEAQILFDADKLDSIGFIGVARLLMYDGMKGKALYKLSEEKEICVSAEMSEDSTFVQEYNQKKAIAENLYIPYAKELALRRIQETDRFYQGLLQEISIYEK